jgi:hypothetical protein
MQVGGNTMTSAGARVSGPQQRVTTGAWESIQGLPFFGPVAGSQTRAPPRAVGLPWLFGVTGTMCPMTTRLGKNPTGWVKIDV